jgi:hypothetical protein
LDDAEKRLLNCGQLEARRVVNEIFRLDDENYDWNDIEGEQLMPYSAITTKTITATLDKTTRNHIRFG